MTTIHTGKVKHIGAEKIVCASGGSIVLLACDTIPPSADLQENSIIWFADSDDGRVILAVFAPRADTEAEIVHT